jgi:VanZ family protein
VTSHRIAPRALLIRILPAIVWMALIFTLSAQSTLPPTPGLTAEARAIVGHFTVYGALAALYWWALGLTGIAPGRRLLIAFLGAVAYGLTDELHQSFVPGRDASFFDIAVDAIGATTGLAILNWVLRGRRQPGERVLA